MMKQRINVSFLGSAWLVSSALLSMRNLPIPNIAAVEGKVVIPLEPMISVPAQLDSFEGFYFQPVSVEGVEEPVCEQVCPCGMPVETCDCETELACGGDLPLDLSLESEDGGVTSAAARNELEFDWLASSDNTKFISIDGNGRTRIEFQATYPCNDTSPPYQEISGGDITYDLALVEHGPTQQSYSYNPSKSFVILGKCDGCAECEVYTRMQFDPQGDEGLHMAFTRLTFRAEYDMSNVVEGNNTYSWSTKGYCWMRDAKNRRRRLFEGGVAGQQGFKFLGRKLEGDADGNSYKILPLSDASPSSGHALCAWVSSVAMPAVISFLLLGASLYV